ncbi:MAG: hypothetical protein RR406_00165 [Bacilli bacterium]
MASIGRQIAESAKNIASDFYNGAVKGVKKANFTVDNAFKKSSMPNKLNNNASKKSIINTVKAIQPDAPTDQIRGLRLGPNGAKIKNAPVKAKMNYNNGSIGAQAGNFVGGGTRDSFNAYKNMKGDNKSIINSIKQGHKKADGKYDTKKIAGTAFGVGVAGRIATGGGLYKDQYGNTNLPGVPFI